MSCRSIAIALTCFFIGFVEGVESPESAASQMRDYRERAQQLVEEGKDLCTEAQGFLDEGLKRVPKLDASLENADEDLGALRRRLEALKRQLDSAERYTQEIRQAGLWITEAHSRVLEYEEQACEKSDEVEESYTRAERQLLVKEIRQAVDQAKAQQRLAESAYESVPASYAQLKKIWDEAEALEEDFQLLKDDLVDLEDAVSKTDALADMADLRRGLIDEKKDAFDLNRDASERLFDQVQADFSVKVGDELEKIYKQIDLADRELDDCLEILDSDGSEFAKEISEIGDELDRLLNLSDQLNDSFESDGVYVQIRDDWLRSEAGVQVMDMYLAQIQQKVKDGRSCSKGAGSDAVGPITVKIPDVTGLPIQEAIKRLDAMELEHFRVEGSQPDDPAQAFHVEWQNPSGGLRVTPGDQVMLRVFQAQDTGVYVPDVEGLTVQGARSAIDKAGLKLSLTAGDSARLSEQAYRVQRQDPKAGTSVEQGTEVTIRVYGAFPEGRHVPNVVGLTQEEASTLLKAEGLFVHAQQGIAAPRPSLDGKVQYQQPSGGTEVTEGDTITLTVYSGTVRMDKVPNIVGLSSIQAAHLLQKAGYSYSASFGKSAASREEAGKVYEQDPPAGTAVPDELPMITYSVYSDPLENESAQALKEGLYVVCTSYFPRLPERLEEGQTNRDWVKGLSADSVQLGAAESPVFLWVGDAGFRAYDPEYFKVGRKLSTSIQVTLVDSDSGERKIVQGGLLLQVAAIFSSYDEFIKAYPKEKYASAGQEISLIRFSSSRGTFNESGSDSNNSITYRGGPIINGWPPKMFAANLALFRSMVEYFDCFVASAVYGSAAKSELQVLRQFRDEVLAKTDAGRHFIDMYYRVGPMIAQALKANPIYSAIVRGILSQLVETIQTSPEKLNDIANEVVSVGLPILNSYKKESRVIDPVALAVPAADEKDHPAKQAAMTGDIYFYGEGVPIDYQEALHWYLKAAELGSIEAMNNVAFIYEKGLGRRKDYLSAKKWYQAAAEGGLPVAMTNLGWMYFNGLGVPRDYQKALELYRQAADLGEPNAQANLAWMHQNGVGVEKDLETALAWYRKAAEQDQKVAQFSLAWMYYHGVGVDKDAREAAIWYTKAAEQGHPHAQSALGWLFEKGIGVDQDYEQAFQWYKKSAEQGIAVAQNNVAWLYQMGLGVPQDSKEAIHWYRQAISQDYALAKTNMGLMYLHGSGVSQDDVEAFGFFLAAAMDGDAKAQNNLGYMYEVGRGVEMDIDEAMSWYKKSAAQGDPTAQYNLGRRYELLEANRPDSTLAIEWYIKAAHQGHELAKKRLYQLGVKWQQQGLAP